MHYWTFAETDLFGLFTAERLLIDFFGLNYRSAADHPEGLD